jgi:hypothetical protein
MVGQLEICLAICREIGRGAWDWHALSRRDKTSLVTYL